MGGARRARYSYIAWGVDPYGMQRQRCEIVAARSTDRCNNRVKLWIMTSSPTRHIAGLAQGGPSGHRLRIAQAVRGTVASCPGPTPAATWFHHRPLLRPRPRPRYGLARHGSPRPRDLLAAGRRPPGTRWGPAWAGVYKCDEQQPSGQVISEVSSGSLGPSGHPPPTLTQTHTHTPASLGLI